MSTVYEDQCTSMMKSCSVLLRMKNISDKMVEIMKTYFMLNLFFFSKMVPFMRHSGKILQSRIGHR